MFQHIIVISSSYQFGKRIAWHYADKELRQDVLLELSEKNEIVVKAPKLFYS